MSNKLHIQIFSSIICFCLISCKSLLYDWDDVETMQFYVVNDTKETIFVSGVYSYFEEHDTNWFYLHTGLTSEIQPGECGTSHNWNIERNDLNKYAIFKFIIVRKSVLDTMTKEDVVENNIYDASYVLTYDELESMGFKLVYE